MDDRSRSSSQERGENVGRAARNRKLFQRNLTCSAPSSTEIEEEVVSRAFEDVIRATALHQLELGIIEGPGPGSCEELRNCHGESCACQITLHHILSFCLLGSQLANTQSMPK